MSEDNFLSAAYAVTDSDRTNTQDNSTEIIFLTFIGDGTVNMYSDISEKDLVQSGQTVATVVPDTDSIFSRNSREYFSFSSLTFFKPCFALS